MIVAIVVRAFVQYEEKVFLNLHEAFLNNDYFSIFLLNNFHLFLNLSLFPVLSGTPQPPGGIQNPPRDYLE